jgi:hypothetical protein
MFYYVSVILAAALTSLMAQSPDPAVGCWHVSFTRWTPMPPGNDSVLYRPLPDTLQLDPWPLHSEYLHGVRRPATPPQELPDRPASLRLSWKRISPDSVELWLPVWWSTGIRAHARIDGDSLLGNAWIYVDYSGYETPQSSVRGTRISCPRGA